MRLKSRRQRDTDTIAPDVYPTEAAMDAGIDDHGLHVSDETCARCGRLIRPTDEARRTATGACVHLAC